MKISSIAPRALLIFAITVVASAAGVDAADASRTSRAAETQTRKIPFRHKVASKAAAEKLKLADDNISSSIPFLVMRKFPNGQHKKIDMNKAFLAGMTTDHFHIAVPDKNGIAPVFAEVAKVEADIAAQVTRNPIRMIQRRILLKQIKAERQKLQAKYTTAVATFPNLTGFLSLVKIGDDLFEAADRKAGRPTSFESRLSRVVSWAIEEANDNLFYDSLPTTQSWER